jgi:signal transduction histidine kinase
MRQLPPARVRSLLAEDFLLSLLVMVLLLVGSGVSLRDDFEISVVDDFFRAWIPGPVGAGLVVASALPLTFRRLAPLSVFVACSAASLAYEGFGHGLEPLPLGLLVALYTLAIARRPLVCSLAAAAYVVSFTVGALTGALPMTDDQYYIDLVSVVATVMLGYGVALGRARATLAEQRSAALLREQDGRTREAVTLEQSRIAREVHDIVAHDVSVMVAQAAAARRVFESRPQSAATALTSIEAVGRDALDGLRRIMTLLRTDLDEPGRTPMPDLVRLPWLLAQVERAGLTVDLTIRGRPRPLSATVELNAFRIAQEALTNVLKHAGPTRVTVTLDYGEDRLQVEVRDWGQGRTPAPSAGYGLISMQQRATMLGGRLTAQPADAGFVVSAWLPLEDADRQTVTAPARPPAEESAEPAGADADLRPAGSVRR